MSSTVVLKIIFSLIGALLATLICFYLMYTLISVEINPNRAERVRISMPFKLDSRPLETREVRNRPKQVRPAEPRPGSMSIPRLPNVEVATSEFATPGSLAMVVDQDVLDINFEPPIKNLVALQIVQPTYPFKALMKQIEGYVIVQFTVKENGTVLDPFVIESEPEEIFDMAALQAIKRFRFRPREAGGDVLAAPRVRLRFRFELVSAYSQ